MSHRVLDLYAGSGVGVALKNLGVEEMGVEIMPEAVETRRINGMETVYNDAWESWRAEDLEFDTLWASHPCQAFSVAGKGAGRKALDDVLAGITERKYTSALLLRDWSSQFEDERVGHVLVPLHYIYKFRPTYVALEHVPTVLPVWKAYESTLREMGYSVVTQVLQAEQYGVPQTRKRAILIARRDGVTARMPAPTHSKYYPRDPQELDEGVQPWVSMADALGWGLTERPSPTITGGGTETGGAEHIAKLIRYTTRPDWAYRRPATTVVSGSDVVAGPGRSDFVKGGVSRQNRPGSVRVTPEEAAALQSYPADFEFAGAKGKRSLQVGNAVPPLLAEAILTALWADADEGELDATA